MVESLIVGYCTHLEVEGKSPKVIECHRYSLGRFVARLRESGQSPDPTAWTAATIRAFVLALMRPPTNGAPLAPHSLKSYASSLRSFCCWLFREEFTPKDVMERVKQPSAPRLVKPMVSPAELRRVLAATKGTGRNALRDEALILFMADTGRGRTKSARSWRRASTGRSASRRSAGRGPKNGSCRTRQ